MGEGAAADAADAGAAPATPGPDRSEVRLAELMGAMSIASDVGLGVPLESGLSVCLLAIRVGEAMDLSEQDLTRTYSLALLRHIGCTAGSEEYAAMAGDEHAMNMVLGPLDLANQREVLPQVLRFLLHEFPGVRFPPALVRLVAMSRHFEEHMAEHCEVAAMLAANMGLGQDLQDDLLAFAERWDGKGPARMQGEQLSPAVRAVQLGEGIALLGLAGPAADVPALVRRRRATVYAPDAVDAFLRRPDLVRSATDVPSVWDAVMDAETAPKAVLSGERLDAALRAMGDFADLKSSYFAGHSVGVANLARAAAQRCGLPATDVADVYRAALAHDVGRAGVSTSIWNRGGPLTLDQWEKVRMHAYHTDRVLARPAALHRLGTVASMHHERLDASGYFRGLPRAQQPPAARIIAAADAFHAMTEPRPHRQALTPEAAAAQLRAEVRAGRLDGEAAGAVMEAAGGPARRRHEQVAGLTAREVEVLRLVARGLSTRDIARELVVSPKTADAHIQHIYTKTGVSSRAAATLFAMQHDLIGAVG
jgi:HD-GYP domain-containing protein (c-di-GMP phosphodiesterase class II)